MRLQDTFVHIQAKMGQENPVVWGRTHCFLVTETVQMYDYRWTEKEEIADDT